ncbi:MAG: AAA family ATPase [Acidobacteriaceae bacterium]|jgi:predicted ATPase
MYISALAVSGYRSLKNVEIKAMLPICIFHGLNNSGKSNILSAIETIFRRKLVVEETTTADVTTHRREGSFWQGRIADFEHNFYLNGKRDITFSVSVTFGRAELNFMEDVLKELHPSLVGTGHNRVLTLDGRITYVDDSSADMALERAVFNKKYVVFEIDKGGKKSFFPKLQGLTTEKKLSCFEELMNLLADSFRVLPSDRYLTTEIMSQGPIPSPTSKTFKRWIFGLFLSKAEYKTFEEIRDMFAAEPFSIGEISFSQDGEAIDIMVKDAAVRLPIGRLGSGHQQMLYIIANLVLNKGRMLGIEELEINLSPTAQKKVFEKLKQHIYQESDLVTQVMITSHSDYFEARQDVRCYGVEHNGQHTTVSNWTKERGRMFFKVFGKKGPHKIR